MLALAGIDLDELTTALQDQGGYDDHRWLIDPATGEIAFWTPELGLDGRGDAADEEELDERGLFPIDPIPSRVWYRDMADFAARLTDDGARRRLARALDGRGPFRLFGNAVHRERADVLTAWNALRNTRALRHAVDWLADNNLIPEAEATAFHAAHPDPPVP
ncbi:hypothetical protein [Dactylosporangium darangshiense]|uniref:UPF0158 family protein n=1 Tax=Dactylosporangium darangshiense TaxID=579108 RepID=A0ABP8DJ43_9ACTN